MDSYLEFIGMVFVACVLAIGLVAGSGLIADRYNMFGFKHLVASFGVLAFFVAPFLIMAWGVLFLCSQLRGECKDLVPNAITNFFRNSGENTRALNASPYILPAPVPQKVRVPRD